MSNVWTTVRLEEADVRALNRARADGLSASDLLRKGLRALARTPEGKASFLEYQEVVTSASAIIVPGLVLAEVDYFLRGDRRVMRKIDRGDLRSGNPL